MEFVEHQVELYIAAKQNGNHFADDIFKSNSNKIFLEWKEV